MTRHICCSWGEVEDTHGTDLVIATDNDDIIFPHVDSCMAIIFIFLGPPKKVIGGHAHLQADQNSAPNTENSLESMLERMRDASEGVKPTLAVFIGAITENDANLWPVNKVLMSNDYLESCQKLYCHREESLDVFYDLGTDELIVQKYETTNSFPPNKGEGTELAKFNNILVSDRKSSSGKCCIIQ